MRRQFLGQIAFADLLDGLEAHRTYRVEEVDVLAAELLFEATSPEKEIELAAGCEDLLADQVVYGLLVAADV